MPKVSLLQHGTLCILLIWGSFDWKSSYLDWRLCCVSPTEMQKGIITWFDTSFKKICHVFIVGEMKRGDKYYKNEMSHGHILLSLVGKKLSEHFYLATLFHICWGQLNKFPIVICSRKINSYFQPQNKNFCKPPSAINGLFETSKM